MTLFVGDDWAEDHHDVELLDDTGRRLGRARLPEGMAGMARLHEMIAEHLDDTDLDAETGMLAAATVVVGIETDRGPWVAALVAAGYQVYAINPMSAARYRERHSTSGAKSDPGDAHVLAEIVRLGRTHQTLIWDRTRHVQRLRQALREYFPAALDALTAGRLELTDPDALELLARAGDPDRAARLSRSKIAAILKKSRRRDVEARAEQIQTAPTRPGAAPARGVGVGLRGGRGHPDPAAQVLLNNLEPPAVQGTYQITGHRRVPPILELLRPVDAAAVTGCGWESMILTGSLGLDVRHRHGTA